MAKRPSLSSSMKALQEDTTPDPEALVSARTAKPSPEPAAPSQPKTTGKRYEGMKKMLIPMEERMHRNLKILAAKQDLSLEKTVQAACAAYIKHHAGE